MFKKTTLNAAFEHLHLGTLTYPSKYAEFDFPLGDEISKSVQLSGSIGAL